MSLVLTIQFCANELSSWNKYPTCPSHINRWLEPIEKSIQTLQEWTTQTTCHRSGDQSHQTTGQASSRQPMFNDTTSRARERTCTQKLIIPSSVKYDNSSANLWWRKFFQIIKMTKEIEIVISTMVNSMKTFLQYRDQLETEFKDIFS